MAEADQQRRPTESRPTGADVHIEVHPGLPPAIAMAICVSSAEQQFIDEARARSYQLAIARGHIRR